VKTAKALKRIESIEAHLAAIADRYKTDDKALSAALSQLAGNLASVKRMLTLLATRELAARVSRAASPVLPPEPPANRAGRMFRGKRRNVAE
jgi:DNA-binding FrmR family transcriptional regulator